MGGRTPPPTSDIAKHTNFSRKYLTIQAQQISWNDQSVNPPFLTRGSAMAEGLRDALVSRNSATTKHPIWKLESRHGPILWHYLRDPTFSRSHAIPECDRHTHTDRQTDGQIQHFGYFNNGQPPPSVWLPLHVRIAKVSLVKFPATWLSSQLYLFSAADPAGQDYTQQIGSRDPSYYR